MHTNDPLQDSGNEFAPEDQQPDRANPLREDTPSTSQPAMRRNLDTGEDEPFDPQEIKDKSIMDFGAGSGGGSAGNGGGA